jgi:hypothetical protein
MSFQTYHDDLYRVHFAGVADDMALLALPDLYGRRHLDLATWAGQTRLHQTSFS